MLTTTVQSHLADFPNINKTAGVKQQKPRGGVQMGPLGRVQCERPRGRSDRKGREAGWRACHIRTREAGSMLAGEGAQRPHVGKRTAPHVAKTRASRVATDHEWLLSF